MDGGKLVSEDDCLPCATSARACKCRTVWSVAAMRKRRLHMIFNNVTHMSVDTSRPHKSQVTCMEVKIALLHYDHEYDCSIAYNA